MTEQRDAYEFGCPYIVEYYKGSELCAKVVMATSVSDAVATFLRTTSVHNDDIGDVYPTSPMEARRD